MWPIVESTRHTVGSATCEIRADWSAIDEDITRNDTNVLPLREDI